jgi:tight adherence protein B
LQDLLDEAGLSNVTPTRIAAASGLAALIVFLGVLTMSESPVISAALAAMVAPLPIAFVKRMQRRRQEELRSVWPDAIEHLASAVRDGLSLPEAINQLSAGGPVALRPAFKAFELEYRVSGRFNDALTVLKQALADPVGDRVVESMRVAREVGGTDLGRLLRTTASFLRDDARVRGELESRQSWTVNAARLAVAAPWVLLLLLATRPAAVAAYNSAAGAIVLACGAGVSFVAYRLMMRLGRLPVESRVLK